MTCYEAPEHASPALRSVPVLAELTVRLRARTVARLVLTRPGASRDDNLCNIRALRRRPCAQGAQRSGLFILCLSLGLVLAGCAATPTSTTRYTLPTAQPASSSPGSYPDLALETLAIEPIRMSSYINSEGIVMQLSDIEIQRARNHLWAETLSRQLERNLQYYLSDALPDTRVTRDLSAVTGKNALQLQIEVEDFQGRYDGQAVVSGHWQLRDASGRLLSLRRFDVAQPLEVDGYPELVRSLAEAWDTVAASLAEHLAQGISPTL